MVVNKTVLAGDKMLAPPTFQDVPLKNSLPDDGIQQ